MKSAFLVKSPLQLLNACEARHHFGIRPEDAVLILMADRKSRPQLLNVAALENTWSQIYDLGAPRLNTAITEIHAELRKKANLFNRPLKNYGFMPYKANRLIRSLLPGVAYLFIGDYKVGLMRHIAHRLPHRETVVLDDGNSTIDIARKRARGEGYARIHRAGIKRIRYSLKNMLLGYAPDDIEAVTFFTAFQVLPGPGDQIITNDFSWLRSQIRNIEGTSAVYFLGSPLVEAGILQPDEFEWHLGKVRQFFGQRSIFYVPHRRESRQNIDRAARLGFGIKRFDLPIEYQLARIGPVPAYLASFISTALENCRIIFGDHMRILSFRLNPHHAAGLHLHPRFAAIYESYEQKSGDSFRVIDPESY